MTDLEHLAELLDGATLTGRSNVAGLLAALDSEPATAGDAEVDGDVAARRIESEAAAVRIMTVWTAKGLEFPIVCVPSLWRWTGTHDPVIYVDPVTHVKTFDLARGTTWPTKEEAKKRKQLAAGEMTGERLRLPTWPSPGPSTRPSCGGPTGRRARSPALARMLFARDGEASIATPSRGPTVAIPTDDRTVTSLAPLVEASGHTLPSVPSTSATGAGRTGSTRTRRSPCTLEAARSPPPRPEKAELVVLRHHRPMPPCHLGSLRCRHWATAGPPTSRPASMTGPTMAKACPASPRVGGRRSPVTTA